MGSAASTTRKRGNSGSLIASIWVCIGLLAPALGAQSQAPSPQQPANQSQGQPNQNSGIPDAPSAVQPPAPTPEPPPPPKPEEKKPVERDPWTNQPINKPAPQSAPETNEPASPPPPMPPVKTLPPGTSAKQGPGAQEQLTTFVVHTNFVQVPVTVKDKQGRMIDGLLSTDFKVKENGVEQKLRFFSADPFALSVAVVLDLGMSDAAVQKVNESFPALVGAFAPYDEVAIYTYSSTVSQVSDFTGAGQRLVARLNQMKTERGRNSGPPMLGGPLAPNGPIINNTPVGGPPVDPVYTPPKEAHVLNDAILRAALDLSKRDRTRRKIIFVVSDGRESGSQASYKDVLRLLLSNEIQVKAVALEGAALPVYGRLERFHLPGQAVGNLLPKYVSATGGAPVYSELSQHAIESVYAEAMSEARNQYTLGYTPSRPKTPTSNPYRSIEVIVDHPGLVVYAKDGYYPAPAVR